MWISPLAVLWGITKVNCSFTGTGEVTPATPNPPSLPPFRYLPQFLQTFPSLSPHHSIAQMHPATDGLTWELCATSPSLSRRARTEAIQCMQTNSTASVLHRHGKHGKHAPTRSQPCVKQSGVMRGRLSDDGDTGLTSSLFGALQTALLCGRKKIIYSTCTKKVFIW